MEDQKILELFFARNEEGILRLEEQYKAYCAKIVRNAAINRFKMIGAKKRASDSFTESVDELGEDIQLSFNNVEDHINEEALVSAINDFLSREKKELRIFFVRRYFYHDEIKEIASKYKVGESKVKVSLHRMREALKKKLQEEGLL